MISADTIAALEAEKIEYILGVRERTSREVRTEIIADDGLAVPLVIPRQKGETELAIRETTIAERRYVICRNEEEAKKDAAARAELVAGLKRKLAQGDKAFVANKGFRRFLKTPEGGGFVIDRAKIAADARFDGLFVLRTNTGSPLCRSCCATAICGPSRTLSKPPRRCSPPAPSFTRPTPAFAATSSAPFSRSSCARSSSTVSQLAAAGSNGSASSTISPISARSRSNRTAAGRGCAPPPARPSTRFAALSASPCRRSSRRCRPPHKPP